ncbi:hypothetical protein [Flavobacterium ovatum]|jgi:hypothetical protein|uniref:hypothetical protein n=1 Tax=Flavobacterium ovatum TaxID=1928857 RepID=UPI00344CBC70
MNYQINELIDFNLSLIHNGKDIRKLELKGLDNKTLSNSICLTLYEKLLSESLIDTDKYGRMYLLSKAHEIINYGGWVKYLKSEKLKTESKVNLDNDLKVLQKESLQYQKTIRKQSDRIRYLDEQIKTINLLKEYWWFIVFCIILGGLLKEFMERIGLLT